MATVRPCGLYPDPLGYRHGTSSYWWGEVDRCSLEISPEDPVLSRVAGGVAP
jgi:hypothetical protein